MLFEVLSCQCSVLCLSSEVYCLVVSLSSTLCSQISENSFATREIETSYLSAAAFEYLRTPLHLHRSSFPHHHSSAPSPAAKPERDNDDEQ